MLMYKDIQGKSSHVLANDSGIPPVMKCEYDVAVLTTDVRHCVELRTDLVVASEVANTMVNF